MDVDSCEEGRTTSGDLGVARCGVVRASSLIVGMRGTSAGICRDDARRLAEQGGDNW